MRRKRKPEIEPGVEVHDHFDGSAHCVECRGPCKLTGPNRIVTELVRYMFDSLAYRRGYFLSVTDLHTLRRAGVDVEHFQRRAGPSDKDTEGQ